MAEAAWHEITTDTSISSDETSTYADGVKMNASNIALTITSTGKVKMIESAGYNNNTITVQGKVICGSSSSSAIWGAATGAKVYIKTGANVQGEIYAGRDDTSEVSGNKLDISSGTIEGNIFGGVNNNITAYDVKNNAITISGSSITGSVIGGTTLSGKASLNTVNISGDATAITGEVVGGRSANSNATENKVIINGGNYGSSVIGGNSTDGKNATDNTVTIESGTITGNIYGGLSTGAGAGAANNNTVTIRGCTITSSSVVGGSSYKGNANGNTVTISGGTIGKAGSVTRIWGGFASNDSASNVSANDNTVTISGDVQFLGSVSIYGAEAGKTSGTANNNTVNILAKITAAQLAGGNTPGTSSGNTLNIVAKGVTARSVYAF